MATNRDASRRNGLALPDLQKKPQRHRFALRRQCFASRAAPRKGIAGQRFTTHGQGNALWRGDSVWPSKALQSNGNAWLSLTTHGSGMALHYGAKPRKWIESRCNGYETQANAMAPLSFTSHRHCWEKRRQGQGKRRIEPQRHRSAQIRKAKAKNSNRKLHF